MQVLGNPGLNFTRSKTPESTRAQRASILKNIPTDQKNTRWYNELPASPKCEICLSQMRLSKRWVTNWLTGCLAVPPHPAFHHEQADDTMKTFGANIFRGWHSSCVRSKRRPSPPSSRLRLRGRSRRPNSVRCAWHNWRAPRYRRCQRTPTSTRELARCTYCLYSLSCSS